MADETKYARELVAELKTGPGVHVGVTAEPALHASLMSILGSAGAEVVEEESDCAIIACVNALETVVPKELRDGIGKVAPGGRVAIWFKTIETQVDLKGFARTHGPRLDLHTYRARVLGEGVLITGTRRERVKAGKLKALRRAGHGLQPTVLVGRGGVTEALIQAASQAVERHGLIKIKLTPQCSLDKQDVADTLAWSTGSQCVQRVGKTALLFRPEVPLILPVAKRSRNR
jgi:RNA-binding protein